MKSSKHAVALLTAALLLRLLPVYVSGAPYSTDVWPLIRVTERLLKDPGAKIWLDELFDGYNNRWPGAPLSVAVVSAATSISPVQAYTVLMPVVLALAVYLLLAALLHRLGTPGSPARLAAAYLLLAPSLLVFTSACLKEVYAYPLMLVALAAPLLGSKREWLVVMCLLGAAMPLVHHLATLATVAFLASAFAWGKYLELLYRQGSSVGYGRLAAASIVLLLGFAVYYVTYGGGGLGPRVEFYDLVMYLAYALPVYATAFLTQKRSREASALASLVATAVLVASARYPALLGFNLAGSRFELYVLPLVAPLAMYAASKLDERDLPLYAVPIALFAASSALYATFGNPLLPLHRVLNYAFFYIAMLVALLASRESRLKIGLLAITALSCAVASVGFTLLRGDSIGSSWLYTKQEELLYDFLCSRLGEYIVAGDSRVSYALSMKLSVDVKSAVEHALAGKIHGNRLYLYTWYNTLYGLMSSSGPIPVREEFWRNLPALSRVVDYGLAWGFAP